MRIVLITSVYPGARTGGAEYQTSILGKELAARGHDVMFLAIESYLAKESSQKGDYWDEGIRVREVPGWQITGRSEHYGRVKDILEEFQADICYLRYLIELNEVGRICRDLGVAVVSVTSSFMETSPVLTGHDPRTMLSGILNGNFVRHWKAFWAIRHSAAHVCNSKDMAQRMRHWIPSTRVVTVYNGSPMPSDSEVHQVPGNQIIWVNNLKRWKRPEKFIELARRLPEYRFVMIGSIPERGRYADACRRLIAGAPENLFYLGGLPVEEVNRHIAKSDLLVYTSKADSEGFGNSLLQAWFRAVPTVCLSYNVDGILEREGIGFVTKTMRDFVAKVRELMEDPGGRMLRGERARIYANSNHRVDHMVNQYEDLFRDILDNMKNVSA